MMMDFLIVGGGIAGISAAARLSHMGTVLVLEAEGNLAYHASGRSAALYEPNYGPPPIVALSHASGPYLAGENGGVLSPRGLMLVAGADEMEGFRNDLSLLQLDEISFAEALQRMPILNPETVTAVGYADHGADIDTDRLVQNFAREARANGARIITDARVTAISAGPGGTGPWEVRVGDQAYTGRILVNAAGAWADQIARLAGVATLGLTPKRRSVARIAAPEGMDPSTWPMVFGADESWYCKPDAGALIVSPAEADPSEPHDAWADDMVLAEGIARYQDKVTAPVTRLLSSWAGLRTFAPDHCPVIGFAPGNPAFFWLAGQGGYGFQSAPATSALVADLIGGRAGGQDPALIASVSPARFMMGA